MLDAIAAEWGLDRACRRAADPGGRRSTTRWTSPTCSASWRHRLAMIGSDGLPHDALSTSRACGAPSRACSAITRATSSCSAWRTAVRKMTGRTAAVFGMADRGVIRQGAFADLVLFDPATVRDAATYEDPTRPAEGIVETWVNGRTAFTGTGGAQDVRAGRLLTRQPG